MLWVETDEEYKFAGDMDDGKHMGVLLGEYISILSSMQNSSILSMKICRQAF